MARQRTVFHYRLIDILHFSRLVWPVLEAGIVSIERAVWERTFCRARSIAAMRAWSRFTRQCRDHHLVADVVPLVDGMPALVVMGWLHLDRPAVEAEVVRALGPPLP